MLRHYDSGDCQGKLGHSRASVIWHRAQVFMILMMISRKWQVKQIVQLYVAGDRNLCWVWDSPRLGLPRPSCRCPLHHLLQMQVFKLLSSSFSARNICSPSVLPSQFSVKVQNLICCDTECLLQKWFLPKDWKLVELGKALLILPLTWVFRKLDLCSGGIAGFRGSAGAR